MDSTTLLTSSAPGTPGVGGVLIQAMLGCEDVQPVRIASILAPAVRESVTKTHTSSVTFFDPVDEFYDPIHKGIAGTIKRLRRRQTVYDRAIEVLAERLRQYLNQNPPEQLWLILNSLATIDVATALLPAIRCRLLVQVWDDAEHLCLQRNCDRLTRRRTVGRFRRLLARADRTAVICEQMREAYRPHVKNSPIVIRLGVDTEALQPRWAPSHPSEFRIGLSGSMYCHHEWRILQQCCDNLGWTIDGKRIVLVVVGGRIEFRSRSNAECRFYGWRPPEETHEIMSSCDVLYLPQSSAPENDPLTRLSFPTKLSSYVATGRPILVQAPRKGSLRPFCETHHFGAVCDADDLGAIERSLRLLATDKSFRVDQAEASCRVAREVLTARAFAAGVRSLLGIPRSESDEPLRIAGESEGFSPAGPGGSRH
ncbi:hypothetical protein [Stieleria mannarensis]|uniref:hypothetical protein n=1 Tax=Stieleria mannarensis TaxID=2755585 RepID=UPI001603154F|nr:hypothetical protein [Rhodopirellula sp. JC639]